ncbi:peptidyl-prolyl cis-trans isomerase [Bacillus sp. 1P06AnD]|uniref:peptidyl-prolyl cis-trans isomerase n=1 Tax=Bacillus sp. 1P06AnD TaxID=3132208 RepID=UPI0039A25251
MAVLVILNIVTLLLANRPFSSGQAGSSREEIASVGNVSITREQLWRELEKRYGQETLSHLIDNEVVKQTAKDLNVSVSEDELKTELVFIKTLYGSYDQSAAQNEGAWEQQIRNRILLEKLLVHDVKVKEERARQQYDQNPEAYKIPTTYHLSHIVVDTKKQAKQVVEELKEGASFSALAKEKSTDDASVSTGGDIGYLSKKQTRYAARYIEEAAELKKHKYSKPFKVKDGYSIIYLNEKIKKKTYPFSEVKGMIERQLALEEMSGSLTADYFWKDRDVENNYKVSE